MFTVNIAKLNPDGTVGKAKNLTLPKTRKTLDAFLMDLGVNSQNDYAYSILSINAGQSALAPSLGSLHDIDELNDIALIEKDIDQDKMDRILSLINMMEPKNAMEFMEIMRDHGSYSTLIGISNYEQLGRYATDMYYKGAANILGKYMDFESFGKDFHDMHKGKFTKEGYLVNGSSLMGYDSSYLPYLNDGSIKGLPISIANKDESGKLERPKGVWLNLPVSEYTLDRAVHRLGVTSLEDCYICDRERKSLLDVDFYKNADSITELNMVAERLTALETGDLKKVCAIIEHENTPALHELINILHNLDCYDFHDGVALNTSLGRSDDIVINNMDDFTCFLIDKSQKPLGKIEFTQEGNGKYFVKGEGGQITSYGYIKRNDVPMSEVYTPQVEGTLTMGGM